MITPIAIVTSVMLAGAADAAILRVDLDAPPGGDGLSWATALQDPGEAFAAISSPSDQVWIAEGVYIGTWSVPSGARVYGGFSGTESLLAERDPATHLTTFSGDVLGNDEGTSANREDNLGHLLVLAAPGDDTLIDGIIFTSAGDLGSPTGTSAVRGDLFNGLFRNCTFTLNAGYHGAGFSLGGGSSTFEDCIFVQNLAYDGGGASALGGMITFTRCHFQDNSAHGGAAIFLRDADGALSDCTVSGNEARIGAALYAVARPGVVQNVHVERCIFEANDALNFGGVFHLVGVDLHAADSTFADNLGTAGGLGGMVGSLGVAEVRLERCVISGHTGQPTFLLLAADNLVHASNCLFTDNDIDFQIYPAPGSTDNIILLESSTMARRNPGIGLITTVGMLSITNSILHNTYFNSGAALVDITHTLMPFPWPGEGNVVGDPRFEDVAGGDYNLRWDSPALNAGTPVAGAAATDLHGRPRVYGLSTIDLGCLEYQHAPPGDVNTDGVIDLIDLNILIDHFGGPVDGSLQGDVFPYLSGDGRVDFTDLNELLRHWSAH